MTEKGDSDQGPEQDAKPLLEVRCTKTGNDTPLNGKDNEIEE